ncbi:MAG: hypothetical protein R6W76_08455 [Caldilinea sp.]
MKRSLQYMIALLSGAMVLLAGCRPIQPQPSAAVDSEPLPIIENTGEADTLSITVEDGATRIDIVSPRGIGEAQVRFTPESVDSSILLRFHLQGLEQAFFDNGDIRLEITLSSHAPYVVSQWLSTDHGAQPLVEDDDLWAHVELVSADDAAPTIPLQGGHIDVTLPPNFMDAQHPVLSLRWIDFHR